ncbi:MAG: hypothetical protein ABSC94_29150 [Polyangiaceae bacterium]
MIDTARPAAFAACGLAVALLITERLCVAQTELRHAVERIASAWRAVGATVLVDDTHFLNDDETLSVIVPDLPDGECTTTVLLGARGLGFHVSDAKGRQGNLHRQLPSEAGALSIEQCGSAPDRRLLVTSDSGRGALELVVARSASPLPPLQAILPERTGGGLGPLVEPGALAPLPPPDKRAEVAEARAQRDGATIDARSTSQSGLDGAGAREETLEPGCHALELFAMDPRTFHRGVRGKLDLDAEMRDSLSDRLLARDRSDAPDAQLGACVGEATRVGIVFVGSPPNAPVLVAHFAWPLPPGLPTVWGPEARARMAHLLLVRHVTSVGQTAILLAQGGTGSVPIPLTVEPGACYLAMVALVQGAARNLGLRVRVGVRDASDDRGIDDVGGVVAFCAGDHAQARAQVEAHGTPLLGWGFALYRIESGVWELLR